MSLKNLALRVLGPVLKPLSKFTNHLSVNQVSLAKPVAVNDSALFKTRDFFSYNIVRNEKEYYLLKKSAVPMTGDIVSISAPLWNKGRSHTLSRVMASEGDVVVQWEPASTAIGEFDTILRSSVGQSKPCDMKTTIIVGEGCVWALSEEFDAKDSGEPTINQEIPLHLVESVAKMVIWPPKKWGVVRARQPLANHLLTEDRMSSSLTSFKRVDAMYRENIIKELTKNNPGIETLHQEAQEIDKKQSRPTAN